MSVWQAGALAQRSVGSVQQAGMLALGGVLA